MKELIASIKKDVPFAKDRMLSAIYHPERNHLFDAAIKKIQIISKAKEDGVDPITRLEDCEDDQ